MQNERLLSEDMKHIPPSFVGMILKAAADPNPISFAGGLPNPISFPQEALLASMERVIHEHGSKAFQYSSTAGLPQLRQYIADRYNRNYGLGITADNILITSGSQQAVDLIGKAFLDPGDGVILEEPTYLAAVQTFSFYRPAFHTVPLTEKGLDIPRLGEALSHPVKFMYAIPEFQNPTGLSYSAENREQVYQLLKDTDVILVEDDPYGELRFKGEHLPYIGMGRLENSILLGSFSKIISPGMRIGFVITKSDELMRHLTTAKEISDVHTNILSQYLIWDYLEHNDLDAHIKSISALYQKQAQTMLDAMEKYFPASVTYTRPKGGMFLWVTLPEGVGALDIFPKALEKGVAFVPGDPFYVGGHNVNTMRLNYTNADPDVIVEGIRRLGELLHQL